MKSEQESLELIRRCIDGTATEDDRNGLQEQLRRDPSIRRLYARYANIDATLGTGSIALTAPMVQPQWSKSTWLSWRPLMAAAAGIVFGIFCTSMVFGLVSRPQTSVKTLLLEGFEDAAMVPGQGVPSIAGVWSGDLRPPSEASGEVKPAEGDQMVVLSPSGSKWLGVAYRFVDLTSLPPLEPGQSRQIEVAAQFHGMKPKASSRLQMRLAVFAEDAAGAREIWMNDSADDLALLHVVKPAIVRSTGWTTVRSKIDVPAEAKVLLVSLGAGVPRANPNKTDHYLDDVQIRLITQEAPLP